ncbi:MAG: tRNA (N6-threonylcarbamoyladenosine(37)-N6)-methyltransferase TrmO [Alphaproteobacteria bacterium]|nr:tRNA (N6-threonylcarbamoyladenosine(37)-N6)-methyltransferase TrmO [Alphaproteobacteria bacterium]
MSETAEIRPGEETVNLPAHASAGVYFIGRISTPWKSPRECPRRGDYKDGPLCQIEVFASWDAALAGLDRHSHLQILYWMDRARRDLVLQSPCHSGVTAGTFSLRSPNRPNPVASSLVALERIENNILFVRGLDCADGTPLIDIKPENCPHDSARKAPA